MWAVIGQGATQILQGQERGNLIHSESPCKDYTILLQSRVGVRNSHHPLQALPLVVVAAGESSAGRAE